MSQRISRGEEPPHSSVDRRSPLATEWPYMAFVAGLFLLFIARALIFP
jgi:hypothetical protein